MEYQLKKFALEEMKKWGLTGWSFKWDNAKKRAGVCRFDSKEISISRILLVARGLEETKETVLHEIAHVLAGLGAKHGPVWESWARKVGAKPERCFSSTTIDKSKIQYKYTATCPNCKGKAYYSKKLKYSRSCGKCSPFQYNEKYKVIITQNY